MRRQHRQGGFLATDAMLGLGLVVAMLAVFAASNGMLRRSEAELAARREAARAAEAALLEMQSRGRFDAGASGFEITVRPIDEAAPAGYAWVAVAATRDRVSVELVGLTPTEGEAR